MSDREVASEPTPIRSPDTIQKFEGTFKAHFEIQRKWGGEEPLEYPRYRALNRTFSELGEERISNSGIRELVNHLITNRKYSRVFKEWIRVHGGSWDLANSPQNIHRIYSIGRNELLRRKGKSGLSG